MEGESFHIIDGATRHAMSRCVELLRARVTELEARPNNNVDLLRAWFTTQNPMLGNTSPLDICKMGRGMKLAQFVENAIEEASPARSAP